MRLATDDWQATLYALASHGVVNVLSRPTIMTRNNQQAAIVVGQEVPLVTSSQVSALGNTSNSIQYQDVGIILRVTPFISSDRTVEMIVAPEISSLDSQSVQLSPGVSSPIIDKRAAETVVVTPDQKTIVIGGMMQKQLTSSVQKIPVLGDLPLIGAAFRHTVKNETRTELLIFLTPYIIEGTNKLEALTDNEVNRTDLTQKAFSQEDLDNYLDSLKIKQRQPATDEKPKSPLDPGCDHEQVAGAELRGRVFTFAIEGKLFLPPAAQLARFVFPAGRRKWTRGTRILPGEPRGNVTKL